MLQLGNHKGWISVDGNKLPEYGVQYSEDGKTAACWIPSKVDKVKFLLVILSSSNMALSCTTNTELCDMLGKRRLFVLYIHKDYHRWARNSRTLLKSNVKTPYSQATWGTNFSHHGTTIHLLKSRVNWSIQWFLITLRANHRSK
jgi:hypothetical protein